MEGGKRRLGDLLVEMELVSAEEIDRALAWGKEKGLRLGEALIELGLLTEDQILWTLAQQTGLSFIRVSEEQVLPEVVRLIPEEMARRNRVLPLLKIGNELTLAVNDPLDENLFADIARLTGAEVRVSLAKAAEIQAALDRVYGVSAVRAKPEVKLSSPRYRPEELRDFGADKSGRKLLVRLVEDALRENVDKIHLDVRAEAARVRFREHLGLSLVLTLPAELGRALLTRLSILGKSSSHERAQSFRVDLPLSDQQVTLDVHVQKVAAGEAATLRILGKRAREIPLSKLGLTPAQRATVSAMLSAPGLVVITGPANSGRATTVMSLLAGFDPATHRIITAEDWVRTAHPDYAQVHRDPASGSGQLSRLLLLDADVIYVESLTSPSEMETALRAGMSGTFIFTLMGFRRSAHALAYLTGLGLQPALVAEGLAGIIAEHLLRKLCDKCKSKVKLKKAELAGLPAAVKEELTQAIVFGPKGCKACQGTGFSGREAVFEVLALDAELRELLVGGKALSDLPLFEKKMAESIPQRVLAKVKAGTAAWTELLAFR